MRPLCKKNSTAQHRLPCLWSMSSAPTSATRDQCHACTRFTLSFAWSIGPKYITPIVDNRAQNNESYAIHHPFHGHLRRDPPHCLKLLSAQPHVCDSGRVWLMYLSYDSCDSVANEPEMLQGCIRLPLLWSEQRMSHCPAAMWSWPP